MFQKHQTEKTITLEEEIPIKTEESAALKTHTSKKLTTYKFEIKPSKGLEPSPELLERLVYGKKVSVI